MISIIGTPGAGKTTQTKMLADYLGCPWFSQGELIREKTTGKERQDMLEGKIIDDKVTLKILSDALDDVDVLKKECIVEGNPRTLEQAKWWEECIKDGRFKVRGFIHLIASEKVVKERLMNRGRVDDFDGDVVKKRLSEYQDNTKYALDYLRDNGHPVFEIDASGNLQDVADKIHKALKV